MLMLDCKDFSPPIPKSHPIPPHECQVSRKRGQSGRSRIISPQVMLPEIFLLCRPKKKSSRPKKQIPKRSEFQTVNWKER